MTDLNVIALPKTSRINQSALEMAQSLVERIKSGEVVTIAVVEVRADKVIAAACSDRPVGTYHLLNSGAARLAHMLAGEE